ncbi:MAG: hypothetical protein H0W72_00160 [Planctomycetes bacterium]|nr:hypothetical protein [Planctomycetota bacterium]
MSSLADARRGMTLVELLVAIPLSIAVVAAAVAAFTLTARVVALCERMSRTNQAVREAYLAAADEVDFWWSVDDPFNAARQPQRNLNGGTGDGCNGNILVPIDLPDAYWNWDVADPRTWQRGPGSRHRLVHGDYSIVSRLDDPDPALAWNHQQMDAIFNRLGMYGMAEYMPAPTYWWYITARDGSGTYRNSFGDPVGPFTLGLPGQEYEYKYGCAPYKLLANCMASPWEDPAYMGGRFTSLHWRMIGSAPCRSWMAGNTERFNEIARSTLPMVDARWPAQVPDYLACTPDLRLRPMGWPKIRGGLMRIEKQGGRLPQLQLEVLDERTGERTYQNDLFIGTTLRGARQQRDWPHWNPPSTRIDR